MLRPIEGPEVREDRMSMARDFLTSVLVPAYFMNSLTEANLLQLKNEFIQSHPGSGSDFDITHVQSVIFTNETHAALSNETDSKNEYTFIMNLIFKVLST